MTHPTPAPAPGPGLPVPDGELPALLEVTEPTIVGPCRGELSPCEALMAEHATDVGTGVAAGPARAGVGSGA